MDTQLPGIPPAYPTGLAPRLAALLLLGITLCGAPAAGYEISSYAIVNENATLRIDRKTIHLYGVHIPSLAHTCDTRRMPPVCGSRAAIALDFKVDGFVRCNLLAQNKDGSYVGYCRVNATRLEPGEDLAAYLLQQGWAVALPNSPVQYQALEKIARTRQLGYWGTPADRITRLR